MATYVLVKNWGRYYLISVLEDFRRRILSQRLKSAMTARDFSDAVEAAWETAGLHSLRETERPRFVTACGAALISRDCGQYLDIMDIGHMLASSYHP